MIFSRSAVWIGTSSKLDVARRSLMTWLNSFSGATFAMRLSLDQSQFLHTTRGRSHSRRWYSWLLIHGASRMSRPKLPEKDTAHFFELETSLHRREIRNSPDAVSALLADDFLEFGSSGKIWDKPSMVASMEKEQLDLQVTVEDFAARELAPGVVLVTYVSRRGEGNAGDPSAPST